MLCVISTRYNALYDVINDVMLIDWYCRVHVVHMLMIKFLARRMFLRVLFDGKFSIFFCRGVCNNVWRCCSWVLLIFCPNCFVMMIAPKEGV